MVRRPSPKDPHASYVHRGPSASSGLHERFSEQLNVDVVVDLVVDGDMDVDSVVDGACATELVSCRYIRMLSFQRLRVYQRAIEFLALAIEIVEQLPRGHAERADQLIRAAESVIRNIAEGAGRWSRRDSSKHYKIARGEAMECVASLDVLKQRNLVDAERYDRGIDLLQGVVSMLTKML